MKSPLVFFKAIYGILKIKNKMIKFMSKESAESSKIQRKSTDNPDLTDRGKTMINLFKKIQKKLIKQSKIQRIS